MVHDTVTDCKVKLVENKVDNLVQLGFVLFGEVCSVCNCIIEQLTEVGSGKTDGRNFVVNFEWCVARFEVQSDGTVVNLVGDSKRTVVSVGCTNKVAVFRDANVAIFQLDWWNKCVRNVHNLKFPVFNWVLKYGKKVSKVVFYTADVHFVQYVDVHFVGVVGRFVQLGQEFRFGVGLGEFVEESQNACLVAPCCLYRHKQNITVNVLCKVSWQGGLTCTRQTFQNFEVGCAKTADKEADCVNIKVQLMVLCKEISKSCCKFFQGYWVAINWDSIKTIVLVVDAGKFGEYLFAVAKVHGLATTATTAFATARATSATNCACLTGVSVNVKTARNVVDIVIVKDRFVLFGTSKWLVNQNKVNNKHNDGTNTNKQNCVDQCGKHHCVEQISKQNVQIFHRDWALNQDTNTHGKCQAYKCSNYVGANHLQREWFSACHNCYAMLIDNSRYKHCKEHATQKQRDDAVDVWCYCGQTDGCTQHVDGVFGAKHCGTVVQAKTNKNHQK